MAENGYNPFGAPPIPSYGLTIKTRHVSMAGTDVPVRFTLVGAGGILSSDLDASYKGMLASGATNFFPLEGGNVGNIQSLEIAELDSDIDSDWLPESITLESNMIPQPITFQYGPHEWLKFHHPITKTP